MNISNDKKSFYQWETNRFLVDEDFKINQEVCFSSVKLRKALVVKTKLKNNKIVVEVPNLLLQDYHPIMVHWVIADENGKYVTKEQEFQVLKRAKPEDYVYTETEIFSFLDLEQRLKNLEEEGINKAIADYFVKNPIQSGATSEQAAQIIQNKENIEKLNKNKLDADKLPEAINNALTQAEASGAFKGEPGKDGVVPVTGAAVGQTVKVTAVDENGNPTEWEATDFPESSTQTDWNQNDESAVDYIKNKPFYEADELVVISECEVTSITTNEGWRNLTDGNGNYAYPTNCDLPLATYVYGDDYVIDINGETYNLKLSQSYDGSLAGVYYLGFNVAGGNNANANLASGAKFAIFTQLGRADDFVDGETFEGPLYCYLSSDIALPATIKIKHRDKVLKQLDSKYIKDMYHTETVQKSETREFVGGEITDAEFAALLYENRQTAVFTHPSGRTFAYLEDDSSDENYWFVKTDIEGAPPLQVRVDGDTINAGSFTSVTVNYEVEKVHKLDVKYLPDSVKSQADWNQNDEAAPDYIKNRPFYEAEVKNTFGEGVANGFTDDYSGGTLCLYETDCVLPMSEYIVGEEYVVNINGEEHLMKLDYQWDMSTGSDYVGFNIDTSMSGSTFYRPYFTSDYDFGLSYRGYFSQPDDGDIVELQLSLYLPQGTILPVTVQVYQSDYELKQLDPKYIKDMYYDTSIEEVVIEEDVEMTAGMNSCEGSFSVNINVVPNDTYTLYVNGTLYGTATTADGHLMFGSGYNLWQINDGGRVYTFYDGGVYTLKLVHNITELKQLDEKYIPDTIARAEDVEALQALVGDTSVSEQIENAIADAGFVVSPSVATVGQILSVKSVDENGKPTEWEAVNPEANTSGLELVDRTTGAHYNVYVDNGKLTMEVV